MSITLLSSEVFRIWIIGRNISFDNIDNSGPGLAGDVEHDFDRAVGIDNWLRGRTVGAGNSVPHLRVDYPPPSVWSFFIWELIKKDTGVGRVVV